jgi:uncharacterized protein with HEPN domain
MMDRQQRKLLLDIIEAIDAIDLHLDGERVFAKYVSNRTKRSAVERELAIIGEAVSKLLKTDPRFPLSYARLIVDMRNRVLHAYDSVDNIIIWKTVMKDIPLLKEEAEGLLAKHS